MKLAVCLYKFFPYGGLSRDFLRIMQALLTSRDTVDVYTIEWQGDIPAQFNVHIIPVSGWSNHARLGSFHSRVAPYLQSGNYDLVLGFNKMPGLDLYYAADPCYLDRIKSQPFYPLLKYSARVRFYTACERAVFGKTSHTISFMISDVQRALFQQHYHTADARLIDLPPGIDPDRKRPQNAAAICQQKRQELGVKHDEWLLLMVGTGFKTKGVDRSIDALAQIPHSLRNKTKLFIVGDGENKEWLQQARTRAVAEQLSFLGGRADVPELLLAADLLLHPARKENTGTVILEAMTAGLPMLVSAVCGYAKHVTVSGAGEILLDPDNAKITADHIISMLNTPRLQRYSEQALHYAATQDLYSMPEKAAQVIRQLATQNKETA